jgi:hypothetical protein
MKLITVSLTALLCFSSCINSMNENEKSQLLERIMDEYRNSFFYIGEMTDEEKQDALNYILAQQQPNTQPPANVPQETREDNAQ